MARSGFRGQLIGVVTAVLALCAALAVGLLGPAASAAPVTQPCGSTATGGAPPPAFPSCSVTVSATSNLDDGQVVTVSWTGTDPAQDVRLSQCGEPGTFPGGSGGPCGTATVVATAAQNSTGAGSASFTVHTGGFGTTNGGGCPAKTAGAPDCVLRLSQGTNQTNSTNTSVTITLNPVGVTDGTAHVAAAGGTATATLTTAHEPGDCFLDAGASLLTKTYGTGNRLTVTISNSPAKCAATFADAGTGDATVCVDFWAKDAVGIVSAGSAKETVTIGGSTDTCTPSPTTTTTVPPPTSSTSTTTTAPGGSTTTTTAPPGPVTTGCGIPNFTDPYPVPGCTVTVSNTSFLKHGDVLKISWVGMDATKPVYVQQCFAPNPNASQGSSGAACSNFDTGATPSPGASGARFMVAAGSASGAANLTVHTGDQGSGTCPPPAGSQFACSVYVSQSTTAPDQRSTRVPIGFGTAAPTTTAPTTTTVHGSTTGGSTGGTTGSSLPKTGQDLLRLALLGIAAIAAGFGLSYPRWSRRRRLATIDVKR